MMTLRAILAEAKQKSERQGKSHHGFLYIGKAVGKSRKITANTAQTSRKRDFARFSARRRNPPLDAIASREQNAGMKIVFLGSGAFGIPALLALINSEHQILHIISQPDRPAGRGKVLLPTPVSQWALGHALPLTRTENANAPEILERIKSLQPDCLVAIAFGQKLSDELLALAPHRGINLHASLLPKYRGAAPINWAIINQEPRAGVCVIELVNRMDAGDILASASLPIEPADTASELHDRLAERGSGLIPKVLDEMAAGNIHRVAQDESLSTRAPKLSRQIAWVDFTQDAKTISARICGMSPWPGIQIDMTDASGKSRGPITLLKCIAVLGPPHPPELCGIALPDRTIACATGSVELLTVQPAGKKPMDLQPFANGYGFGPGAAVRSIIPPPPP